MKFASQGGFQKDQQPLYALNNNQYKYEITTIFNHNPSISTYFWFISDDINKYDLIEMVASEKNQMVFKN